MCIPRARVDSATVYVDWLNGSDNNDGTAPAPAVGTVGPLKTLQRALDYAAGNFDLAPPFTWTESGNVGYRPGVVVQMAKAPSGTPYLLPAPAFLDGLGASGPVTLQGDPANPLDYNVYANNSLQGLTAQNGGKLILNGFTLRGDANCTLVNPLEGGTLVIANVWLGPGNTGLTGAVGAAGKSRVEIIGNITLIGSGFSSVFTAIESGMFSFAPGASVTLDNVMNFGIMFNLAHAEAWTQGAPITWNGAGLVGSTGQNWNLNWGAFLGFSAGIPGSGGYCDATSVVL